MSSLLKLGGEVATHFCVGFVRLFSFWDWCDLPHVPTTKHMHSRLYKRYGSLGGLGWENHELIIFIFPTKR